MSFDSKHKNEIVGIAGPCNHRGNGEGALEPLALRHRHLITQVEHIRSEFLICGLHPCRLLHGSSIDYPTFHFLQCYQLEKDHAELPSSAPLGASVLEVQFAVVRAPKSSSLSKSLADPGLTGACHVWRLDTCHPHKLWRRRWPHRTRHRSKRWVSEFCCMYLGCLVASTVAFSSQQSVQSPSWELNVREVACPPGFGETKPSLSAGGSPAQRATS